MARRGPIVLAVMIASFVVLATDAGAHAQLVGSDPADGAALAQAPREITLTFSEEIAPRFRRVLVFDARGRVVPGARLRPGGDRTLTVSLPALAHGTYEASWDVVATDDGHATSGASSFGVGAAAVLARHDRGAAGPKAPDAIMRWLDVTAFALLAGSVGVGLLLTRSAAPAAAVVLARRRLLILARSGAVLALATGVGLLVHQAEVVRPALPGRATMLDGLGQVLGARWGILWAAREIIVAALVCGLALRRGRQIPPLAAAAGLGAVAVTRALSGHAGALPSPGTHVALQALHVLAAWTWIGGVAALTVAVLPGRGLDRADSALLLRALRGPFAIVAATSVVAVCATGLYIAGAEVASLDALTRTGYGTMLIVKALLILVACGVGGANFLALRRPMTNPSPWRRRLIAAEAAVGAEILLTAALLTAGAPARGPQWNPPRAPKPALLVRQAGDLLTTVSVRPDRPGLNVVTVAATSSRRPPPAPIDGVTLKPAPAATGRSDIRLAQIAPSRWAGGVRLDHPGTYPLTVAIHRAGEQVRTQLVVPVQEPDPAHPVRISARPLAPVLDTAALVVLLIGAAGAGVAAGGAVKRRLTALPILGKEIS